MNLHEFENNNQLGIHACLNLCHFNTDEVTLKRLV